MNRDASYIRHIYFERVIFTQNAKDEVKRSGKRREVRITYYSYHNESKGAQQKRPTLNVVSKVEKYGRKEKCRKEQQQLNASRCRRIAYKMK